MSEPERIRASNAEREAVIGHLNEACSDGRLTLDELSSRVEQAWSSRTRGDLEGLVRDLPAADAGSSPPARGSEREEPTQWHISPVGGYKRRGRWRMPARTVSIALLGGVNLDLGDAELSGAETTLTTIALVGGVHLRVPPGVRIVPTGVSLLGGHRVDIDDPGPGAPTIRVRVFSLVGGVRVRSSRPLERWRNALRDRAFQ